MEMDVIAGGRWHYELSGAAGHPKIVVTARYVEVDEPRRLAWIDDFVPVGAESTPVEVATAVDFYDLGAATRLSLVTTFKSASDLERGVQSGMGDGFAEALGRIDVVLADLFGAAGQ
jgi:uncharacterized protein YndB with AHSA1/START domain